MTGSSIRTLILLVWYEALSCWKYQPSELGNIILAERSKYSSRINVYVAWFMRPSQRQIWLIPALLKHFPDHRWPFYSETLWVTGLSRSPSNHKMTRCWSKLKIGPYSSPLQSNCCGQAWSSPSLSLSLCLKVTCCQPTVLEWHSNEFVPLSADYFLPCARHKHCRLQRLLLDFFFFRLWNFKYRSHLTLTVSLCQ